MDKNDNQKKRVALDAKLPDLPKRVIFAITFGFLGINMGFSLQSSQMSRIFQSIGANPNSLGFFFIFPPLMGMIVQPLIGKYSAGPGTALVGGCLTCSSVLQSPHWRC